MTPDNHIEQVRTPSLSTYALFCILFYVSLQLLANISSIKVGYVLSYAVDMGVFLYPLTFTLRDVVHRICGKVIAQKCIVGAVVINLFMAFYLWFIGLFPADTETLNARYFDVVLSPVWRIVIFSLLAQFVSELIDTHIYHRFEQRFKSKYKWGRVLISNTVSIPIDNLIFCIGAFAFSYSNTVVIEIFVFNFIVKYVLSLSILPLIYFMPKSISSNVG